MERRYAQPLFIYGAAIAIALVLAASRCAPPPPNLSPQAATQYNKTRVIKGLDLIRDTAVDANSQVPPQLSTNTMLKVVGAHKAIVQTIDAQEQGWVHAAKVGLEDLLGQLDPGEQRLLRPYIRMAESVIEGVAP